MADGRPEYEVKITDEGGNERVYLRLDSSREPTTEMLAALLVKGALMVNEKAARDIAYGITAGLV